MLLANFSAICVIPEHICTRSIYVMNYIITLRAFPKSYTHFWGKDLEF